MHSDTATEAERQESRARSAAQHDAGLEMTFAEEALEAAGRLFSAVEEGRVEDLRAIFADDAVIWHNTDDSTINVEQSIKSILRMLKASDEYRYTEIKREPTPSGFVQQHVLLIALKNGARIVDRACCVCGVKDRRITYMNAYHDSAPLQALWRH
jgi:ketosteroid isomerase-like protein